MDYVNKYQTTLKLTSTKHNNIQARSYLYPKYTAAYTLICQRREYLKMLQPGTKT